jgi:hypothetical protein
MEQYLAIAIAALGAALIFAVDKIIPASNNMAILKTIRENNNVVGATCLVAAAYYFLYYKPAQAAPVPTSVASSVPTSFVAPSSAAPSSQ